MEDINIQQPVITNQIETERPNVERTQSTLTGYIANSMNGGHNKTIFWKRILPGEKHGAFRLKLNTQLLTPISPAFMGLSLILKTYFVPDSRVWTNADKFYSQKGGSSETKVKTFPNLGGQELPTVGDDFSGLNTLITNTTLWRDSFISSYIPRIGTNEIRGTQEALNAPSFFPAVNALPLRSRIAIFNDCERNREYTAEQPEFKGDTVTAQEMNNYLYTRGGNFYNLDFYTMRSRRDNSYYTNYRTELQGFEVNYPPEDMSSDMSLINWNKFEQQYRESKAQASNAQKRDIDVIKELFGTSKLLTEKETQLISVKKIPLQYSAITQTTYNNNEQVREEYRVMGKQGAYSYTDIDIVLYQGMDFIEGGTLHVIATVTADSVFESGIDRTLLNINTEDNFRPDQAVESNDVLYELEINTNYGDNDTWEMAQNKVIGFKRKFSELFKLPNVIGGDMTTRDYYSPGIANGSLLTFFDPGKPVITNNTFQFFEENPFYYEDEYAEGSFVFKNIWKDYTDILINKNQAVKNEIAVRSLFDEETGISSNDLHIAGQNQIFFCGMAQVLADLPVPTSVKNDFSKWGEH